MEEIHSVILNLNTNLGNNKGSNFNVMVNRQLEIKPNSLVALYKGNIARKPIVLPSNTQVQVIVKEAEFPSELQIGNYNLSLNGRTLRDNLNSLDATQKVGSIFPNLTVTLDKGKFSRLEFCRQFCNQLNRDLQSNAFYNRDVAGFLPIEATDGGQNLGLMFPYRFYYEQVGEEFFLGLRYELEVQAINEANTYYNAQTFIGLDTSLINGNSNNVTFDGDLALGWDLPLTCTGTNTDWRTYAIADSPLKPQSYSKNYDAARTSVYDVTFAEAHIQCGTSNAGGAHNPEIVFGLSNTYFLEHGLGTSSAPTTSTIPGQTGTVPTLLLGARFQAAKATDGTISNNEISLYALQDTFVNEFADFYDDTDPTTNVDALMTGQLTLLAKFDPLDYNLNIVDGIKARWVIYGENGLVESIENSSFNNNNPALLPTQKYYAKFCLRSPYQNGEETVIYDSKSYGLCLENEVVNSGYLFQQLKPNKVGVADDGTALSGGLTPCYFWNNNEPTDFKVSGCRAQNVVQLANYEAATNIKFCLYLGTEGYRLTVPTTSSNPQALENILRVTTANTTQGIEQQSTFMNPNAYPANPAVAGITSLGSDLSRYNIELNLPVRAYCNTENSANDIGQQRTIVFNTDPVIEETGNFSAGLVNRNFVPPELKFLSLNNPEPIKLNSLMVQIRNSKTNDLAEEITDAGIELLIKSKTPSTNVDLVI